jgi:hypothetical protein
MWCYVYYSYELVCSPVVELFHVTCVLCVDPASSSCWIIYKVHYRIHTMKKVMNASHFLPDKTHKAFCILFHVWLLGSPSSFTFFYLPLYSAFTPINNFSVLSPMLQLSIHFSFSMLSVLSLELGFSSSLSSYAFPYHVFCPDNVLPNPHTLWLPSFSDSFHPPPPPPPSIPASTSVKVMSVRTSFICL